MRVYVVDGKPLESNMASDDLALTLIVTGPGREPPRPNLCETPRQVAHRRDKYSGDALSYEKRSLDTAALANALASSDPRGVGRPESLPRRRRSETARIISSIDTRTEPEGPF